MESHQILSKPKLGFSASFREAFKILSTHPKFISLVIFFSFPLLASLLAHHTLLLPTFIQFLKLLPHQFDLLFPSHLNSVIILCRRHDIDCNTKAFFKEEKTLSLSHSFLISTLLFSALVFFLDLLNTIATVSISAALYGGGNTTQMGFKEMLLQARRVNLRGPLATSLCALSLASLTLLGFVALTTNTFITPRNVIYSLSSMNNISASRVWFLALVFVPLFMVLLVKYIEWSAVWNMGIVISIVDKNQGYIAIGVASYLSRGSRKLGFRLMMVFFVLKVAFGLPCLYALWNDGSCGVLENVVSVSFNCVANVVMWVVLMVYFYDCKREFLEKKIDLENSGKAIQTIQTMN